MDDDIGNKTIGDTHTHVDFPYRCKRCGKYINIKYRLRDDMIVFPLRKGIGMIFLARLEGLK